MQFFLTALATGLGVAMPYTIELPSITIDLYPTLSSTAIKNTTTSMTSFSNQTISMALATCPTLTPSATSGNKYTSSSIGACGPGIGSCPSGLCCSGYGYCGSNSSYCGINCVPNFGVCEFNTSRPSYSFSYDPITTSTPLDDGTGAAGIVTDDLAPSSSITMFSYAPESGGSAMALTTASAISFEPMSTTYTAVKSTWAAVSYQDASVTTVTVLKEIDC